MRKLGLALALASALTFAGAPAQPARADGGAVVVVAAIVLTVLLFKVHKHQAWVPLAPAPRVYHRKKKRKH